MSCRWLSCNLHMALLEIRLVWCVFVEDLVVAYLYKILELLARVHTCALFTDYWQILSYNVKPL